MLRKSLMLAACFCFLAAPLAMAQGSNTTYIDYQGQGLCRAGKNGSGEVLPFANSASQCFQQGGQSWGHPGQAQNNEMTN